MVIVEMTASVEEGTTYTFVCVLADGLIDPSLLKFCGIFYIPDSMSIVGIALAVKYPAGISIATFAAEMMTPFSSNTNCGI